MKKYQIRTLQPSPSMSQDVVEFTGTYAEAVAAAQASWRKTQRATSVVAGTYCWYSISGLGKTLDKNTVGAPVAGQMDADADADEDKSCRTHGYDDCPLCTGQDGPSTSQMPEQCRILGY